MWKSITQQIVGATRTSFICESWVRMMHLKGNQIRTGLALDIDGKLYRVTKSQHVKPGKGGAYVQCDLKELTTGQKVSRRFRAAESVQRAQLSPDRYFQYLYQDSENLVLMDKTTFEQIEIPRTMLSDKQSEFLVEGMDLALQIINGQVLWASMPEYVTLKIVQTAPKSTGKGSTSNMKSAKLENGADIKVPVFLEVGTQVKVATSDGTFMATVDKFTLMIMVETLYDILAIKHNASFDDIRKAYHRAARLHHPDKRSSDASSTSIDINQVTNDQPVSKFHNIQTAYEILRDVEKRKMYDLELQQHELIEKTQNSRVHISEEINKDEMSREEIYDDNGDFDILYSYNCRCGDRYEVFEDELADVEYVIVSCIGCSLNIRVLVEDL